MIIRNDKPTIALYKGSKEIIKRYKGTVVVYEAFSKLLVNGAPPLTLLNCKGVDLVDYKIFGNSTPEEKALPDEYQEVEYITSKQSGDIITDVIATNNIGIDMVLQLSDIAGSQYILGSRESKIEYAMNGSGSRTDWDIRFNGSVIYSDVTRTGDKWRTKISMINGNGTWYLSNLDTGEEWNFNIKNVANMNSTIPLTLFSYNTTNGTGAYYYHNGITVYSLKMYDGETLIRDFKPCYRKSDNVIGMYDIVGDKFYEPRIKTANKPFTRGNRTGVELESVGEKTKNLCNAVENNMLIYRDDYSNFTVENGKVITSGNTLAGFIIPVEPNTTYSFGYKLIRHGAPYVSFRLREYENIDSGFSGGTQSVSQQFNTDGLCSSTITTLETTKYVLLTFYATSALELYDFMANEGDSLLDYDGYGYKIPVTVSNNLFKTVKVEQGSIADASGDLADSNSRVRTNLFVLEEGTYNISMNWSLQKCMIKGVHIYSYEDEKWIKYISGGTSNLTFSLTEKSKIRIVFNKSASAGETIIPEEILNSDVIIRPGETTTDFMEEISNIYLNEPLRKLGDYSDIIDFKQGKVIRRIGKYTYDGSEDWLKNATTTDGYGAFRCEGYFTPLIGAPANMSYMTHFNYTTKGATADFKPGEFRFAYGGGSNIGSSRVYVATIQTTVEDFVDWVTKNKPTIYYPIEGMPEEIDLPNIPTFNGTTILEINTDIQPSNLDVIYKGKK